MSRPLAGAFLDEALRIGRAIAGGALCSRRRATWLADEVAFVEGYWQRTTGTLGADLARGTAGVGWCLARLAATAADQALASIAIPALHHGLQRAPTLIDAEQLDWYHGASGIAWAAIDAGRALGDQELLTTGERVARDVVKSVRTRNGEPSDLSFVGGEPGVVAGLLALDLTGSCDGAAAVALDSAQRLAEATLASALRAPAVGLARGLSGAGLVLAAVAAATGQSVHREAAERFFAAERTHFEPGVGWVAPAAHSWSEAPTAADASWCRGAAGIGLARLDAHSALADLRLLAEGSAAVGLVREHLISPTDHDASICHGAGGAIELLLAAGLLLGEPAHTQAARTAGSVLIQRSRSDGRYAGGFGSGARNPSLMFGLAGTASVMLRLHDPAAAPSPALPPIRPR